MNPTSPLMKMEWSCHPTWPVIRLEAGSHYIQTWGTQKVRVMRKEIPFDLLCPQMAAIRQLQYECMDWWHKLQSKVREGNMVCKLVLQHWALDSNRRTWKALIHLYKWTCGVLIYLSKRSWFTSAFVLFLPKCVRCLSWHCF